MLDYSSEKGVDTDAERCMRNKLSKDGMKQTKTGSWKRPTLQNQAPATPFFPLLFLACCDFPVLTGSYCNGEQKRKLEKRTNFMEGVS